MIWRSAFSTIVEGADRSGAAFRWRRQFDLGVEVFPRQFSSLVQQRLSGAADEHYSFRPLLTMIRYFQLLLIFSLFTGPATAASATPTHCLPDEYIVTNAWMGPVKATGGGWKNTKEGKLLSLCADKQSEPFEKLSYRYGVPGSVELEVVATESKRFFYYSRSTSPHTGEDIIFFSSRGYTYYVAIAGGQGHGVFLRVYSGRKLVFNRFSGNYENDDYSVGPAEINYSGTRSEILELKKPFHKF